MYVRDLPVKERLPVHFYTEKTRKMYGKHRRYRLHILNMHSMCFSYIFIIIAIFLILKHTNTNTDIFSAIPYQYQQVFRVFFILILILITNTDRFPCIKIGIHPFQKLGSIDTSQFMLGVQNTLNIKKILWEHIMVGEMTDHSLHDAPLIKISYYKQRFWFLYQSFI